MLNEIVKVIIAIVLIIAVLGGLFFIVKKVTETSKENKASGKPSIISLSANPPEKKESQPEKEISENKNKEEIEGDKEEKSEEIAKEDDAKNKTKIMVLNGGTASGSAGEIKKLLENSKYENVGVTDALSSNHIGQMVYHKKGLEDDAEKIKDLVKKEYPGIDIKEGKTAEQTSEDIVIMLGK